MLRLVWLLAALGLVTASGLAVGATASLSGLGPRALGAGVAVVAACDANGFSAEYHSTAGALTQVTLSGIADPGCEGGVLSAVIAGSGGASVGSAGPQTIATDGDVADNSVALTIAPTPAVGAVAKIHVVVHGP